MDLSSSYLDHKQTWKRKILEILSPSVPWSSLSLAAFSASSLATAQVRYFLSEEMKAEFSSEKVVVIWFDKKVIEINLEKY